MEETVKTWTVVKFVQENSVSAVPTPWIIDGVKCLWPPYAADKITAAIKAHTIDTCWPSYRIEVFRNSTFPDYETARSKSITAEYTSDLNTTDNDFDNSSQLMNKKKRKIHRIRYSSSSEDEVEKINEHKINSPPKMKKVSGNNWKERRAPPVERKSGDASSTPSIFANQDSRNMLQVSGNNSKEGRCAIKQKSSSTLPVNGSQDSHSDMFLDSGTFQGINRTESCTCCPKHGKYNRETLQNLLIIRSLITDLKEDVTQLKSRTGHAGAELDISKSIFSNFETPLNQADELDTLNTYLKDEDNFKYAAMELSKIGGNSENDFVKRTITRIISDELAIQYSWLGRKQKKSFNNLEVARLIINAANILGFTNKKIEQALAGWLKRASERIQRNK